MKSEKLNRPRPASHSHLARPLPCCSPPSARGLAAPLCSGPMAPLHLPGEFPRRHCSSPPDPPRLPPLRRRAGASRQMRRHGTSGCGAPPTPCSGRCAGEREPRHGGGVEARTVDARRRPAVLYCTVVPQVLDLHHPLMNRVVRPRSRIFPFYHTLCGLGI